MHLFSTPWRCIGNKWVKADTEHSNCSPSLLNLADGNVYIHASIVKRKWNDKFLLAYSDILPHFPHGQLAFLNFFSLVPRMFILCNGNCEEVIFKNCQKSYLTRKKIFAFLATITWEKIRILKKYFTTLVILLWWL